MSSGTVAPATKLSWIQKVWAWITGEVKHVENGIEEVFGPTVAAAIDAAGKGIADGEYAALVAAALADATDVVTGKMSIGKAISSLIALFEQEGKTLSQEAALQIIGNAQNLLPANAKTVTVTA